MHATKKDGISQPSHPSVCNPCCHSEATPHQQSAAEDEEKYLLILRFLEGSSCTAAFEALKREVAERGLIGSRTDWTGASRPTTYERELDRRAPSLPSEHLPRLLDMVLRMSRERVCVCLPRMLDIHACRVCKYRVQVRVPAASACASRKCACLPRVRRSPLRLACPPHGRYCDRARSRWSSPPRRRWPSCRLKPTGWWPQQLAIRAAFGREASGLGHSTHTPEECLSRTGPREW